MRTRLGAGGRLARVAVTAVLALAAGACTGQDGDGVATAGGQGGQPSASASVVSQNTEERVRQFVRCLRDQGVDVPDPEPGDRTGKSVLRFDAEGADKATLGAAMEKCNEFLPQGGENRPLTPEQIERQRVFAQCMRDNGFPQWPDPDPETGNFRFGADIQIDKRDPGVATALERCRVRETGPSAKPGEAG